MRGVNALFDTDRAELYGVSTIALRPSVKRNMQKFSPDFMFHLTKNEKGEVVTSCDHLRWFKFYHSLSLAFTEHGSLMTPSVMNNAAAVAMSVYIIRAFMKQREMLAVNEAILKGLAEIDKTLLQYDTALRGIYEKVLLLLHPPPDLPKRRFGFHNEQK